MKKIFPCSVLSFIFEIFFLVICGFCIAGFIYGILSFDIIGFICSICSLIIFIISLITFIAHIKRIIVFTDNAIFVGDDIADKRNLLFCRIQHKTLVKFDEINSISMCFSTRDSKGKYVRGVLAPMPYLTFMCKGGQKKMINVYYYNNKQVAHIIDEVKNRALLCGNDLQIESGKEIVYKFTKEAKFKDMYKDI